MEDKYPAQDTELLLEIINLRGKIKSFLPPILNSDLRRFLNLYGLK
tara:strand:- start:204 stop:341 length:138 start_codon:yes stop_codon:yes gene_type:complete